MATYAISFNLEYDDKYIDRYNSLMKVIRSFPTVWEETTSFALIESTRSLEEVERSLFLSEFSPSKDKMLVINVSHDACIGRGKIKYPATLRKLMPAIEIK
ncbi:hypothetical protein IR196_04925 [Brucella anthropi]|uniref:hypothetical protein n=1 Tax=Brucella anthropi TaxID=529 RepID=UPI00188C56F6|nr:hypothetical protein [Brucella anthropi]QPA25441.1 hypothetical protein IR196_04925 [Brucella anthropi]